MHYNKFKLRENIFIIFIFIIILEYQLSFVHTFLIDRIIKIFSCIILLMFFKNIRDNMANIYIKRITGIYLALFSVMITSTILNLSVDSVTYLIKYSLLILIILLLLYKVNPNYFSDRIIKFPILIGAVFSLNSIILWFLFYFGIEPQAFDVVAERFTRITTFSYLWGDMIYLQSAIGKFSRACGFFETPSRYANFLIFPAFVSFGYFVLKKRYIYLFACIVCSVVIFLTFSLTNLLACIAVISLSIFFGRINKIKELKKSPFMAGIVGILLALMLIFGVFEFYQSQYSQTQNSEVASMVFRGGYYNTLFDSFVYEESTFAFDISKPFGSGLATIKDGRIFTLQYALPRWNILLGYPGVICFIVFLSYMFIVHVFPALTYEPRRIERYVALAFVAQTISEFQEGSWLDTNYLFTTAILVLLKKYEFMEMEKFSKYAH